MTTAITSAPVAIAAPAPNLSVSHISLMHRQYGPRIHMDDNAVAGTDSGGPVAPMNLPADAPQAFSSETSAGKYLANIRWERAKAAAAAETATEDNNAAESAEPATAEQELAQADADPETDPSEVTPAVEPKAEKLSPIEPPRSWTKDRKEQFNALPRDLQEYVVDRVQEQDRDFRTRQNDAAEKLKGLTAKEQQAEQAMQAADDRAKASLEVLEREQLREFPDIRKLEDLDELNAEVARLGREAATLLSTDPFGALNLRSQADQIRDRLTAWDNHQKRLQFKTLEVQQAKERETAKKQTETAARKASEYALLIEKAPEFADAKKLKAAQDSAVELFREKGCTDDWFRENGDNPLLDDHHLQLIIADAMKYRAAKAVPPKAAPKPVPPVQRPGITPPRGAQDSERIQALATTFNTSGSLKDAIALRVAQSKRRA